jgi:hypothetical protein
VRRAALAMTAVVALAGCGGAKDDSQPVSATAAQACLKQKQIPVVRGLRAPDDADAPDVELIVGGKDASAFLGFYEDAQRAEKNASTVKKSVTSTDAVTVERHGKLTIAWTRGKDSAEAGTIKGCVLGS